MDYTHFLTPTLGVGGILLAAVIMILRGDIVPRSTVQQMRRDKDEQIGMWKTSCERYERAIELKDRQIALLLEGNKTTTHVVAALSEAAGLEGNSHALAPQED